MCYSEDMKALKNRLLLKSLELRIEKAVSDNFGYDPSYPSYTELLNARNQLSEIVKASDPEWWNMYEKFSYREACRNLMVFTV